MENQQTIIKPELIREKIACKVLNISYATLKRKRRAGLIPFVDMGHGTVRYTLEMLEDFKRNNKKIAVA